MKELWKVFKDRNTGKDLCSYTVRGTFEGEMQATKEMLAAEHNIPLEDIIVTTEKRESNGGKNMKQSTQFKGIRTEIRFRDGVHKELFANALNKAEAINPNGKLKADFAASLYIITGIPDMYERVKEHIHSGYIDFESMFEVPFSTGENIMLALAGNLYNGGFFNDYTPWSIIATCDRDTTQLAAEAISIRNQSWNINEIYA